MTVSDQRPVPVVIPTYGKASQVERCLDALRRQTVAVDVLIHDNTHRNIGYTAGVNARLREVLATAPEAASPYAVILNQDCYLAPDAIERSLELLGREVRAAIVGVKQLAEDGDRIIHAGCALAYPAGQHIVGRRSAGHGSVSAPMPWVNGACMVFRVAAVRDFGLMDERFFNFGSDSDWCYAARSAGWEVWYCAEAECLHETGVSRSGDPAVAAILAADMGRWAQKWLRSPHYELLATTAHTVDPWMAARAAAASWAASRSAGGAAEGEGQALPAELNVSERGDVAAHPEPPR